MHYSGSSRWRRRQKSSSFRIRTLDDKPVLVIGSNAFRFIAAMNQQKMQPESYHFAEDDDSYTDPSSGVRYICYKSDAERNQILENQIVLGQPIVGILIAASTMDEVSELTVLCSTFPITIAMSNSMKNEFMIYLDVLENNRSQSYVQGNVL